MNYWAMEAKENSPFGMMQAGQLSDAVHRLGLSPNAAREAIYSSDCEPLLQLFEAESDKLSPLNLAAPDCTFCSWIPIFSVAARDLCLDFGSAAQDFLPCRFTAQPGRTFYLHLPANVEHVVDVGRSEFLMTIPADPPIPFHINKLALHSEPRTGCFRAVIPGHQQVFAELMASQAFKDSWEMRGLTGAQFRGIGTSDTTQLQAETVPGT